jgi:hypothetical protein
MNAPLAVTDQQISFALKHVQAQGSAANARKRLECAGSITGIKGDACLL